MVVVVVVVLTVCLNDVSIHATQPHATNSGGRTPGSQDSRRPRHPFPAHRPLHQGCRSPCRRATGVSLRSARQAGPCETASASRHGCRRRLITTIISTSCNCGSTHVFTQTATVELARPTQQGHRPPCVRQQKI